MAAGQPVSTTVNGVSSLQVLPVGYGIAFLCLALILIAIPIATGFFTFRFSSKTTAPAAVSPSEPLPPPS